MAGAAPWLSLIATTGGMAYNISQSRKARKEAQAAAAAQAEASNKFFSEQRGILEDQRKRQDEELSRIEAKDKRDNARSRQIKQAKGARGRRDTILTGPQGLSNVDVPTNKKVLLGA